MAAGLFFRPIYADRPCQSIAAPTWIDRRACARQTCPVPIEPIAEPRLYQRIAVELVRLIDDGNFVPGSRLPAERLLAKSLQVSRSSLREALSMLELEGRIEIRIGSGAYVTERVGRPPRARRATKHQAHREGSPFDVMRVRRLVEVEAAALAARHATRSQCKALRAAFTRLAAQMQANHLRPAADREFHLGIAQASGNGALARVIEGLWADGAQPLSTRMEKLFVSLERRRDSIAEHKAILDAIANGDPGAARRAMRTHLVNAERQRLIILAEADRDADR